MRNLSSQTIAQLMLDEDNATALDPDGDRIACNSPIAGAGSTLPTPTLEAGVHVESPSLESLLDLGVEEDSGTGEGRDSPIGVGNVGTIGDFEVTVVSVTPKVNDIAAAENQFNDPPMPANQFFMATVSVTYVGATSGNPSFELDFQAVGASNSGYTTYTNSCGVVPYDQYQVTEQFTGGTAKFNVCWQIESSDATSLVM